MTNISELTASFEELWPLKGAEAWDTPGLTIGDPGQTVTRVLLTVDVTSEVVSEAIDGGYQLLLAHHPYLMRGVTTLREDTVKGAVASNCIRAGLAVYAAHTNADVVESGVSDVLAQALNLQNTTSLDGVNKVGLGRVGDLSEPITLGQLATKLARILPHTASGIRVAGNFSRMVERVALCGGAGDSFLGLETVTNADVYITSDLRHHSAQDASEAAKLGLGPALIDVSHWASEFLWLDVAAEQLRNIHPEVVFDVCGLRTDPWDFVITQ
jgi:dinuclear metal center YbgI/SA1388 family protein